jgi:hypothetical protein
VVVGLDIQLWIGGDCDSDSLAGGQSRRHERRGKPRLPSIKGSVERIKNKEMSRVCESVSREKIISSRGFIDRDVATMRLGFASHFASRSRG